LLESVAAGDGKGAIAQAERIAGQSISYDSALEELAAILHRVALAQAGAGPAADEPDAQRVAAFASRLDAGRVQVMYQIALLARRDLPLAPDEFAGFTMALLRMITFAEASGEARPAKAQAPAASTKGEARPKASAPEPAAAPAPAMAVSFDGDWPGLIERLGLTGMAGMVARHGELASFANGSFELVVPEAHRMYAEKAYQDKLKAELQRHFGPATRLVVRVGATAGTSVAAARSREMEQRQASAAEAIEDDPFVRDLVRDFGAEVVASSVRPAEEPSGSTKRKEVG
jgi:DNA polymerase-3 subunit gamma/tau